MKRGFIRPASQEAPLVKAGRNMFRSRKVQSRCHGCEDVVRSSQNTGLPTHWFLLAVVLHN